MLDPFDQKKVSILKEISSTNEDSPDASPKGTIDELCIPIIELINSHNDMVTTSSCSGRVSVFLEGIKNVGHDDTKIGAKGNHGRWIFVTHDVNQLKNWDSQVDFQYEQSCELEKLDITTRYILFKFEPLILHVKCRDLKSATALYTAAMNCGFRESGIGSNNVVAIRISIKLDTPIGYLKGDRLVSVVSTSYLSMLTKLAEDRFKENAKKIDELYKAISGFNQVEKIDEVTETKEQRRERKIREGMEIREAVRLQKEKKRKEKEQKQQEQQRQEELNNKIEKLAI
ncbi:predicted protein [Scheffersomyces stipitis CBS 6054]|uniref:tRNA wybutosine-synthesizing protein 3 n=1 Tax=Scheffersomyces stipitis (strain ATCC 58785 / CBS 6054 / NBRC 10063 / NRRL Y-11545) TaxID=322104 RepID=A3LQU5_PICST|nr:predicted protein [Scheffersomyces stipitis CBS 6054]ABN65624.2 predicted protein [Scheffersomyces stipitis CBS 6054]